MGASPSGGVRFLRVLSYLVPYRVAHALLRRLPAANNFLLDHMYVPVLWLYSAAEARAAFAGLGCTVLEEFPTSFDVFARTRLGRSIVGDGLLRIFVVTRRGE